MYHVTSGDSGEKYWVQLLKEEGQKPIAFCDCPEGKFLGPLVTIQAIEPCKHVDNLIAFLKESGQSISS